MPLNEIIEEIKSHPKRFLLGLALGSLPIAGVLAAGYASKVLRESTANGKPTLPPWSDWKKLFFDGLKLGLLFAAFNVPTLFAMVAIEALGAAINQLVSNVFTVLLLVGGLVPAIVFFASWKRLAISGSFKQALDLKAAFEEARRPPFWKKALKLLAAGVVLLALGRVLNVYGLAIGASSFLFLFISACALGAKTPATVAAAKKPGSATGRKAAGALLVLLLFGLTATLTAHHEPIELPTVSIIKAYATTLTVSAPSYWQYYWLDPENLKLEATVSEDAHAHGQQPTAMKVGDASTTVSSSWCSATLVQAFNPRQLLYVHPQCHPLDNPTTACFKLFEEGFGTWGEFLLSLAQFIAGQLAKAMTGQFTPAGIAVDFVVGQVGNAINSMFGLGDYSGIPSGGLLGETTGVCIEKGLGKDALGKAAEGLFDPTEIIDKAFKKHLGVDAIKKGGFLKDLSVSMITDLLIQIVMDIIRAILEAMGLQGKWMLAAGCGNIATNPTVVLTQPDPNSWQFIGVVQTATEQEPTTEQCQSISIRIPTGGDPGRPPTTGKRISDPVIPKKPEDTNPPPVVTGPPIPPPKPPVVEPPPRPECTRHSDCAHLDKLACEGVVASMTGGRCMYGSCVETRKKQSCDDNNPKTEDKCEIRGDTAYCVNSPLCGNERRDAGENCSTCPEDVKCDSGQYCEAGVCKNDPCKDKGGDTDNDGVCNADDNCPNIPNDQSDKDGDGTGDVCDEIPINCGGWATEMGKESYKSGWTTPGTGDAAKSYCGSDMWSGVDKPVCNTTCLKVTINAYLTPSNAYVCCARAVTRLPCTDCPGQHPTCPSCGEGYDSGIGGGPVIPG